MSDKLVMGFDKGAPEGDTSCLMMGKKRADGSLLIEEVYYGAEAEALYRKRFDMSSDDDGQNPEQQAERGQIDGRGDVERGEPEADRGKDQKDDFNSHDQANAETGRSVPPPKKLTEADLAKMMKDPRYWRDRDPQWIEKVTRGFQELYE